NDPNLFSLKVNHGGGFSYVYGPKRTRAPRRVYKGGNADWFDDVDADGFSVIEVSGMLKELGYENPNIKILYKNPTSDLDKGLEPLSKDIDVLELLSYVHKFKLIELFIEHPVDKCVLDKSVIDLDQEDNSEGIENENVEELDPLFSYPNTNHQKGQSSDHISSPHRNVKGSDDNEESDDTKESEDSEDSDFECDIEDRIDDVYVDMEMLKNTDPSVEWVGSTEPQPQVENNDQFVYEECDLENFDSDIDPDDDKAERKKALRKISKCHKHVDGHLYTENFYVSQRDLLGLDGCFMFRPFPMQILTAVGVDLNNGIYPLAYTVVESKTKQSWLWFLDCLGDDLELYRNSNFTFVTDRQKGIIPALAETFPAAEHRYCLKHIYDNMKLQWRGKLFKELLWRCATATTVSYFNRVMEEVKQANKDVYDWLKDIPPQHWARSHFSARPHCDVLLNNMCEVLNRQLLDGWDKPIITCLEFIREYLMKRIVIVQQVISNSTGPLTPKATKIFEFIKKQAAQYIISWNGGILYQATGQYGDQCVLNVEERSCSCRKWDLTGMPCKHAVAAIWNMAKNGLEPGIPETWPYYSYTSDYHTPIGRPPKKRKKSVAELYDGMVKDGKLSRAGKTVTCLKCGQKVTIAGLVRVKEALNLLEDQCLIKELHSLLKYHHKGARIAHLSNLHMRTLRTLAMSYNQGKADSVRPSFLSPYYHTIRGMHDGFGEQFHHSVNIGATTDTQSGNVFASQGSNDRHVAQSIGSYRAHLADGSEYREEACQSLNENKTWLMQWFDDLKIWEDNGEKSDRITWITIEGLPSLARNLNAVKTITKNFGKILEVGRLDFDPKVLSSIKSLVLTTRMNSICQSVDMMVNGKVYPVKVSEEQFHVSSFLRPSSSNKFDEGSTCFEEEYIGPTLDEQADDGGDSGEEELNI
ncbi:mutator type transposase, partial [Tanacetum coccineum]